MRTQLLLSILVLAAGSVAASSQATQDEPVIDKRSLSVHRVRRGDMPLRLMAGGEVVSLTPAEVVVTVPSGTVPSPQVGQRASVQVTPPGVLTGSVVAIDRTTLPNSWKVTIRLADPFPGDVAAGARAGSLIDTGELKDVVYFERPATAMPHTEMPLFVVDPDGNVARRRSVRLGVQSGALMQILSGLSPREAVIVTDTAPWNSYELIRLK